MMSSIDGKKPSEVSLLVIDPGKDPVRTFRVSENQAAIIQTFPGLRSAKREGNDLYLFARYHDDYLALIEIAKERRL